MDKLRIEGGFPLHGEVQISGAKNAALPLCAAALLCDGELRLRNVPALRDVSTMLSLLRDMGVATRHDSADASVVLNAGGRIEPLATYERVKTMRASVLVLGPLLARFGRARVSLPGGCAIGLRPVDQHIKGLRALGAEIVVDHGYIEARCDRLHGTRIVFDLVTVGGTENLLLAAALADGVTVLENAAREPEVVDLADCLNAMGARIQGAGHDVITIEGVDRLRPIDYAVAPDRVEAGTFLCAAASTGGAIRLIGCRPDHLDAVLAKLREAGAQVDRGDDWLQLSMKTRCGPITIRTAPYPGFPTDMQAQLMALACTADGTSVITETIFENRFMHALELQRMGADIRIQGHTAVVNGVSALQGAAVMATDLRASASLIIAGLAAQGETVIDRIYHLDRGYEQIEKKLSALGARITRFA